MSSQKKRGIWDVYVASSESSYVETTTYLYFCEWWRKSHQGGGRDKSQHVLIQATEGFLLHFRQCGGRPGLHRPHSKGCQRGCKRKLVVRKKAIIVTRGTPLWHHEMTNLPALLTLVDRFLAWITTQKNYPYHRHLARSLFRRTPSSSYHPVCFIVCRKIMF